MIPVLWPPECRALDANAADPVDVLVERAGAAVAHAAIDLMGGTYGRRVTVVCGPGHNGADGRVAARLLTRRGARVRIVDAQDRTAVHALGPSTARPDGVGDLLIDAAFGTGFRGEFWASAVGDAPVLAVDIPSGIDAATGEVRGGVWPAHTTVTFGCAKPGLLSHPGRGLVGRTRVADIGLGDDARRAARAWWMETTDAVSWPRRVPTAHKWTTAVGVVAGSTGMWGASGLVALGAMAAGAGMVRLIGHESDSYAPIEAVRVAASAPADIVAALAKCRAAVVGPGVGRAADAAVRVGAALEWPGPVVLDADGLLHAGSGEAAVARLRDRGGPTVLTPHAAEFARLLARSPGSDVVAEVIAFASATRCVVLLKGPTTVIADPEGRVWFVTAGDERLATAGTGDVLSGVIGAGLAVRSTEDPRPLGEIVATAALLHGLGATAEPGLFGASALPSRIHDLLSGDIL